MSSVIAFDFGASSGRAIKASFDGEKITYSEIHRFDNIPIVKDGHVFHDVDMIVREINLALDKAGEYDSIAFDTWGVDYGLLDDSGKLISMPYHYRDVRTDGSLEKAKKIMPQSLSSLERYLGNGAIKGIGPATAKKIVDKFGEQTIAIFKFEPTKLAQIKGITEAKAIRNG